MDRSLKAALLSALVFPGVGHLYLRRPLRACVFLLPALLAALYFASAVIEPIMAVALQVQSGVLPFDPIVIEARLQRDAGRASPLVNLAAIVMLACWAGAAADAWLAGRARPKAGA